MAINQQPVYGSLCQPVAGRAEDQARLDLVQLVAEGDRLAFSTDSYALTRCSFLAVISASWRFAAPPMTLRSVAQFIISPVASSSR